MKFCPNCGASLMGGAASFCPECGYALKTSSDSSAIQAEEAACAYAPATEPEKVVHKAPASVAPVADPPETAASPAKQKKIKRRLFGKAKQKPPSEVEDSTSASSQPDAGQPVFDDNYDGYYEDILPVDEGQRKTEKLDPDMIKKVAFIAGGALLLVIIAIVILLLM